MRSTSLLRTAGLSLGLGLTLSTSIARADSRTAPVRPFVLPDLSGLSTVGLDLQYTKFDSPGLPGVTVDYTSVTFDLAAEVAVAPHWMVLGRIPVSYLDISLDPSAPGDTDCCGTALGNITVGIRGLDSNRARGDLWFVSGGELSISLPTAPDGDDDDVTGDDDKGRIATTFAAFSHLTDDPGRYLPDTTTIRLNAAAQAYTELFFVEGGIGLQALIYDDTLNEDGDALVRLGIAGGLRITPELAGLLELSTNIILDNDDDDNPETRDDNEDVVTSLDLGLRYGGPSATFGARFFYPIDNVFRDLDMIGFGLDAGARF
jgi:hypothetical protein